MLVLLRSATGQKEIKMEKVGIGVR